MKSAYSVRRVAAALLAACVASTTLVSTASAEAVPTPATGYIPLIPIIFPIYPIIKPVQSTCALRDDSAGTNWFVSRDIRITGYNGWSVDSAAVRYEASVSGNYKFRMVLRHTNRDGDIITKSEVKTIAMTAGVQKNVTTYFGNSYVGNALSLSISHEEVTGPGILYMVNAAGSCTNTTTSDVDGSAGTASDIGFELRGDSSHATNTVVEYFVVSLNKFFVTAYASDQAALDALPDFQRTGRTFRVPAKSTYGNVTDVYRFFSPDAVSHVYVDKSGHDIIVANPAFNLNDEGIDFGSVKPDAAGVCPSWAPVKIYRSYNNAPTVNQRNHRYTNNVPDYASMTSIGWLGEGPAFCAYSATNPF